MKGPQKKSKHHFKRTIIGVFVLVIFFIQIIIFIPKPATALFGVGDISFSTTIGDIPRMLTDAIKDAIQKSGDIAFKNALRTFTQQIAYDAAVKIASGAAGQEPLFQTKSWTEALKDAGNAAGGDFLDTMFSGEDNKWKISICDINPTLGVKIHASIGLDLGLETPRKAKCTLSSIYQNFAKADLFTVDMDLGFAIKGVNPAELSSVLLKQFPEMFKDQADTMKYLNVYEEAVKEKSDAEKQAEAEQAKDFKALTSAITGDTKTPAATIEATQNFALTQTTTAEEVNTGSIVADMIGVFTNTLVKKYMEFILVKGLNPNADSISGENGSGQYGRSSGIAAAEAKFTTFNQPSLGAGGSVDILNTLSSCPTSYAEPENCIIDSSFRTAIEQQLRLEEAIEIGYINGDKPFGYGESGKQIEYTEGYPYRSLVILRRYRVIPVSWELAASYVREFGGGSRSLNELIREYDNETSQYYQLIDPDWVLKAPAVQCINSGYSETLLFDEYLDVDGNKDTPKVRQIQRNTKCVDDQSCIKEDELGNCQAYGYCVKEDPVWRFNGETCPDYYNTCTTYIDSQGQPDSYLRNTLEFNGCSADNTGCQWYCKEFNDTNDSWECYWDDGQIPPIDSNDYSLWSDGTFNPPWGWAGPAGAYQEWMSHLTSEAETCEQSAAGCDEFIRTTHGTNLISNASFEYYAGDPDDAVGDSFNDWIPQDGVIAEAVTSNTPGNTAYTGVTALNMRQGTAAINEHVMYGFETGSSIMEGSYTFSVYAKSDFADGLCNGDAEAWVTSPFGSESEAILIDNLTDQWQRYEATVNFSDAIPPVWENVYGNLFADTGCNVIYDAAMLEESNTDAGQYVEYGEINKVYLNGERNTCDADDVGCQWYSPLEGGDDIPANIVLGNQCPREDVGCKAFEEKILTNPVPNPNSIHRLGTYCSEVSGAPAYPGMECLNDGDCNGGSCQPSISIVPESGAQCSATYVGCEEFTNLDEVAAGGEGKEYYTFLKQCVTPSEPDIDTYYAWEGDAIAGYQLRAFRLKQSDIGPPHAPCTNLEVGPTLPLACEDGTGIVVDCGPAGTDEYGTNPDCTQFFDSSLNIFYRYKSHTITVTEDCHPERSTIDGDVYYGAPDESRSCPAEFSGCREYLGNSGYNYRVMFFDDFEDGTTQDWTVGTVSNESVIVGGHSLGLDAVDLITQKSVTVEDGKTYELKFWGRSPAASARIYAKFDTANGAVGGDNWFADDLSATFPPRLDLVPEWREFRLGPVNIDVANSTLWSGLPNTLEIINTAGRIMQIDNIELKEINSNEYLIHDSYRTCYGSENCEAYSDMDGDTHYLDSFDEICEEDVVGCEALINTNNNVNPFAEDFGDPAQMESFITVPDDVTVRFVNKAEVRCTSADKGCEALGEPKFDEQNNLTGYETVYLKDNADKYSDIWCDGSEVGCEEYGYSGSTGKTYFKEPNGRLCEYKQLLGSYEFDWYIIGTEDLCDKTLTPPSPAIPAFVCEGGTPPSPPGTICDPENPVECLGGSRCVPWVGVCEERYDGCTAYRDPLDPIGCQPNCPYESVGSVATLFDGDCVEIPGGLPGCSTYYNIDTTVDATSCNGVVNDEKGCILFNDTSSSVNEFTADLSPDGSMNMYCDLVDPASDPLEYGDACVDSSDCVGDCFENPEFGPPVLGRLGTCFGGTSSGDPCDTPTEVDTCNTNGGLCDIYMADSSPYEDSNTVLKVRRDRVCDEWLYCKTSFEVDDEDDLDNDGKTEEEVCFEIGLCDELGPSGLCTSTIDPAPTNVTGDTPAYPLEEFQNLSGFVSAGLHYGCRDDHSVSCTVAGELSDCAGLGDECDIIEGLYQYSEMFEVGMGGAVTKDLVPYGDFESNAIKNFMVCDSEMENRDDSCLIDEHCIPDEDFTVIPNCIDVNEGGTSWSPIFPDLNSVIDVVEGENTEGNAALDEDNYLLYTAGSQGVCDDDSTNEGATCTLSGGECTGGGSCEFIGLGAKANLGTNILNNTEYIASLDFRFENLPEVGSEEITVSLAQLDTGGTIIVGENILGHFDGGTGWSQQILEPVEITGIPNENESTYLLIRNMNANVSFAVDNVSMKPVLSVKSSESSGITGDYYTFVYTNSGVDGLAFDYHGSGGPDITGIDNQLNEYEYCIEGDASYPPPAYCTGPVPIASGDRWNDGTGGDHETTTWEGGILFPTSGFYTVFVNINDGFTMYVDDMANHIFQELGGIPTQGYMFSRYFTSGWHPIKIDWFNQGAYGGAQLGWENGSYTNDDCGGGGALPGFCSRYWDGIDEGPDGCDEAGACRDFPIPLGMIIPPGNLTTELVREFGTYLGTYVSDNINYPSPDMADHLINVSPAGTDEMIAVSWTGKILIDDPGDHTFQFSSDDGYKFYIDDLANPVSDFWFDGNNFGSVNVPGLNAGWHPIKIEYFSNQNTDGNAELQFSWDPPSSPLAIVPATHLATNDGDEMYVVRSCRAYPREDSEVCQYTNSDLVEFNGWQGYCIETDPTNANRCITWWPVDVISGESSVFGTVEQAGYKGRRPLYMCVEASGNYDATDRFDQSNGYLEVNEVAFSCDDNDEGYGTWPRSDLWNQTHGYRKPVQTNYRNIRSDFDNDCDSDETDAAGGMGDDNDDVPAIPGCTDGSNGTLTGFYGFCGFQEHIVFNRTVNAVAADQYYEWEIDRIEWTIQRAAHGDWPDGQTTWIANIENEWEIDWVGPNLADGVNEISIDVNFDANQRLSSYWVWMLDGSRKTGGAWVTGTIFLRDVCKEIAQVVSVTDDKAWAQRTANTSSYQIRELLYSYDSDSAPFGAMVAGDGSDPDSGTSWDSSVALGLQPVLIENFDDTPAPVFNNTRSGRPYSCDGDCVPKVCFGGAYDTPAMANQEACTTDADCEPATGERGVCVGVGYCSDEPTVACRTTAADCTPISGGICIGAAAAGAGDGPNADLGNVWAVDNIQRIFAYVYGAWRWDDAAGDYVNIPSYIGAGTWAAVWNEEFDEMPLCNGVGVGPRPTWLPDNDLCGILPIVDNILVNNAPGNVDLFGGGTVTLTFTSFVDPEQEALRNIVIDWGDGSTSSIVWNGAPKSDPSQPHLLSHTYDDPGADETFYIEIMLQDNWGYCNHAVLPPGPNYHQCDINGGNPWNAYTQFGGEIRVYPS